MLHRLRRWLFAGFALVLAGLAAPAVLPHPGTGTVGEVLSLIIAAMLVGAAGMAVLMRLYQWSH